MQNPVVHLMIGTHNPRTACGRHHRDNLPAGHLWCRMEKAYLVSCPLCQRLVPEVRGDLKGANRESAQ